jgi:hypothetical protein
VAVADGDGNLRELEEVFDGEGGGGTLIRDGDGVRDGDRSLFNVAGCVLHGAGGGRLRLEREGGGEGEESENLHGFEGTPAA